MNQKIDDLESGESGGGGKTSDSTGIMVGAIGIVLAVIALLFAIMQRRRPTATTGQSFDQPTPAPAAQAAPPTTPLMIETNAPPAYQPPPPAQPQAPQTPAPPTLSYTSSQPAAPTQAPAVTQGVAQVQQTPPEPPVTAPAPAQPTRYCMNCGTPLRPGALYCGKCSTKN